MDSNVEEQLRSEREEGEDYSTPSCSTATPAAAAAAAGEGVTGDGDETTELLHMRTFSKSDGHLLRPRVDNDHTAPISRMHRIREGGLSKQSIRASGYNFFEDSDSDVSDEITAGSNIVEVPPPPPEGIPTPGLFYSITILLMNVAFVLGGAYVFMYFENTGKEKSNALAYETLRHFETHLEQPYPILTDLLELQQQMCRKNNDRVGQDWVFWGSFQYCNTVITTLGYGLVYPHSAIAKYLTMIYALFGIPIYLYYISQVTDYITLSLDRLVLVISRITHWKWMVHSVVRMAFFRAFLCTLGISTYTAIHLWVVYPRSRDWEENHMNPSVLEMAYWQVVRFTTIGFGDIVVLLNNHLPKLLATTMIGLPLGISCMTSYYTSIRSLAGTKICRAYCVRCACCKKNAAK